MAKNPTYFVNQIDVPGATDTMIYRVNDDGSLFGYYQVPMDHFDFQFTDTNGTIAGGWVGQKKIDLGDFHLPSFYMPAGGNSKGEVVGNTGDGQGFIDIHDRVQTFAIPGGGGRVAGVDRDGLIVGTFSDGMREHGFLYQPHGNQMAQFDAPGFSQTFILAINDAGEIGGFASTDLMLPSHGFVAQVGHAVGFGTPIGTDTPISIPPPKLVG